jgi:hypothetical protein
VVGAERAVLDVPTPTTMLGLVNGAGLYPSSSNTNNALWRSGHASYQWTSRSSTSEFPHHSLRIGVGDAQAAAGNALDFAVFMFEAGNANGDFEGSTVQALGSEGRTYGHRGHKPLLPPRPCSHPLFPLPRPCSHSLGPVPTPLPTP